MSTPTTPTTVEVGQIWRDNDQRTLGAGEFVIVAVAVAEPGGNTVAYLPGGGPVDLDRMNLAASKAAHQCRRAPHGVAVIYRASTNRLTRIDCGRLLNGTNTQRGYTYLGMSR